MKERLKNKKGITLIALVVTIVVLLILAGVSISMLTGENGIIKQASNAKDATEQGRVEELVDLAVNSLIGENQGSTNGITPEMVAEEVNEMEGREDIYAEGNTFPTNIIFPEEGRKVAVDLSSKDDLNEIYSVAVDESDIAPLNLFDYEIIDEAEVGSLILSELPTKKVRITGIKEEYCNSYYNSKEYEDTNYEISYYANDDTTHDRITISDTLVIPYKVDGKYVEDGTEGEMYTITEVQLYARGNDYHGDYGYCFPKVETVVYPNTVEKICGRGSQDKSEDYNYTLKTIVLPSNLKIIGEYAFSKCRGLSNITIPSSVTNVEKYAFSYWESTQTINVPFKEGETSEEWNEQWK